MRKAEQRLWDAMKRNAPKGWWLLRVENVAGEGMPDVFAAANGQYAWIELKSAIVPARATTPLLGSGGLRLSQINWHLKAATVGLRSWVLIRDNADSIYLVSGQLAARINDMTSAQLFRNAVALDWATVWPRMLK